MKNLALLAFMGVLCTISGCSKASGNSPTSVSPTVVQPAAPIPGTGNNVIASKVEAQSTAAQPVSAKVESEPTMFEWRSVHDGMSVAEFRAKHGKNCAENPNAGPNTLDCAVEGENTIIALFFRGHLYSFRAECGSGKGCRTLFAAVKGHFGEPSYSGEKILGNFKARVIEFRSSHELASYNPPEGTDSGLLTVCSHDFSPPSQCLPNK